jgi:acyl carrier protein
MPVLSSIIAAALSVSPENVTREAKIFGDLGAESIDLLDIQFRIEHEFGLTLGDDGFPNNGGDLSAVDFRNELTVGALADFVQERLAQRGAS